MDPTEKSSSDSTTTLSKLLISNFIIVLASKSVVLRWIFTQPESLSNNPISFLILIDETEKLVGFIILTVYQFMFENPSVKHLEYPRGHYILCTGKVITMFFVTSLLFGGFGISLMRLLYVRGGGIIQCFGERKVAGCIFGFTQLIIFVTTYLFIQNHSDDSFAICNVSKPVFTFSPYQAVPIFAFGTMLELAMYISIGHFIYQQNKAMKEFLSVDGFKRRRRENAISFTGHFVHFIFELLICASFPIGVKVYGMSPDVNYLLGCGPLSVATVLSSQTLRRDVIACCKHILQHWVIDLFDIFVEIVGELDRPPTIVVDDVSAQPELIGKVDVSIDETCPNTTKKERRRKRTLSLQVPSNNPNQKVKKPFTRRGRMPSVQC